MIKTKGGVDVLVNAEIFALKKRPVSKQVFFLPASFSC